MNIDIKLNRTLTKTKILSWSRLKWERFVIYNVFTRRYNCKSCNSSTSISSRHIPICNCAKVKQINSPIAGYCQHHLVIQSSSSVLSDVHSQGNTRGGSHETQNVKKFRKMCVSQTGCWIWATRFHSCPFNSITTDLCQMFHLSNGTCFYYVYSLVIYNSIKRTRWLRERV